MKTRSFGLIAIGGIFLLSFATMARADKDWRTQGVVTPVKNQGLTRLFDPSWAFAVTGAIEGYKAIQTGTLTNLSEQQLIDCVPTLGDCADPECGQAPCGLKFAVENGLCSQSSYPYTARQGSCKSCSPVPYTNIPGWLRIAPGDENALIAAIDQGPVLARLEIGDHGAPIAAYANYKSGILSTSSYDDSVHQWVLIVGYIDGPPQQDRHYIIKNSLGTSWGVQGYLSLARDSNQLGIANNAYLPAADSGHGACALPDGSCADMTALDCATAGGSYGGDLSFCPAACATCPDDTTPPVISASATPRPTKKGSGSIDVTVAGAASDDCALDPYSLEYEVTDSYSPGTPVDSGSVKVGAGGSFSFTVSLPATRSGKRSHLYKVFMSVQDEAGNPATIAVAVPIT
jgi:cathepsin L